MWILVVVIISLGPGIIIFLIFFHIPFRVWAGFHKVGHLAFQEKDIRFDSFWSAFSTKGLRGYAGRMVGLYIISVLIPAIISITLLDDIAAPWTILVFNTAAQLAFMTLFLLYQIAIPNIVFNKMKTGEAFAQSRKYIFSQIGPAILLFIILALINALGLLFAGIGLLITIPFSVYCWQYVWETRSGVFQHADVEQLIDQIGLESIDE